MLNIKDLYATHKEIILADQYGKQLIMFWVGFMGDSVIFHVYKDGSLCHDARDRLNLEEAVELFNRTYSQKELQSSEFYGEVYK